MYKLVEFPEVQKYMDDPDFDKECFICVDIDGACFVPETMINKYKNV